MSICLCHIKAPFIENTVFNEWGHISPELSSGFLMSIRNLGYITTSFSESR